MEKFKEFIGIDISKLTFDVQIYSSKKSNEFKNNVDGFNGFMKWVLKNSNYAKEETLFVLEHTGIYSLPISIYFTENQNAFSLVPGLDIKRSLGIQRGKNDKIDAKRIAEYAFQKRDKIKPSQLPFKNILKIRRLISLRDRLVKHRAGFLKDINENQRFLDPSENAVIFEVIEHTIHEITIQIEKIEAELDAIIKSDELIGTQFKLITSIKSVGRQTAIALIAYTNCFTSFDNWRKFATYAGTAPFPYKSGTSIKGRTKVSHLANKKIKALLNMCARSAINCNKELKAYYQKRKAQGDNGMSIMNIIRNKLLSRIFAVIKRGSPYADLYKFAA